MKTIRAIGGQILKFSYSMVRLYDVQFRSGTGTVQSAISVYSGVGGQEFYNEFIVNVSSAQN